MSAPIRTAVPTLAEVCAAWRATTLDVWVAVDVERIASRPSGLDAARFFLRGVLINHDAHEKACPGSQITATRAAAAELSRRYLAGIPVEVADVARTTDLDVATLREIADARCGDPHGRCVEVVLTLTDEEVQS